MHPRKRVISLAVLLVSAATLVAADALALELEQRNEVSFLRRPYNIKFFWRHNDSFRYSSAFHYHHGKQHDVLQLTLPREGS